jgi:hypothetical protein
MCQKPGCPRPTQRNSGPSKPFVATGLTQARFAKGESGQPGLRRVGIAHGVVSGSCRFISLAMRSNTVHDGVCFVQQLAALAALAARL